MQFVSPKCLLSCGAILGGGNNQHALGVLPAKLACGARGTSAPPMAAHRALRVVGCFVEGHRGSG